MNETVLEFRVAYLVERQQLCAHGKVLSVRETRGLSGIANHALRSQVEVWKPPLLRLCCSCASQHHRRPLGIWRKSRSITPAHPCKRFNTRQVVFYRMLACVPYGVHPNSCEIFAHSTQCPRRTCRCGVYGIEGKRSRGFHCRSETSALARNTPPYRRYRLRGRGTTVYLFSSRPLNNNMRRSITTYSVLYAEVLLL